MSINLRVYQSTGTLVVGSTDVMASTLLKPVGEMGIDIAVGSAQRLYLSMHLFIYASMYLSMYLCIYVSIYVYIYVSIYLCIYVSMYLSDSLSLYLSIYL
jgi:hypothetical protein